MCLKVVIQNKITQNKLLNKLDIFSYYFFQKLKTDLGFAN